jgi:hypothetical protein
MKMERRVDSIFTYVSLVRDVLRFLHVTRNIRMMKCTAVQMIRFRYIDHSNVYHNNKEQM